MAGDLAEARGGAPGSVPFVLVEIVAFTVVAFFVVGVTNRERGLPFAGVLIVVLLVIWTFVATRTTFGRHVYAVGATPKPPGALESASCPSG